jgi:endo-1,4-beta-xylanase
MLPSFLPLANDPLRLGGAGIASILILAGVSLSLAAAEGDSQEPALPDSAYPFGREIIAALNNTSRLREIMRVETREGGYAPGKPILEVEVTETARHVNWVSFVVGNGSPIKTGDVLHLSLSMRTLATQNAAGEGLAKIVVQRDWKDGIIDTEFSAGVEWKQCFARGRARKDYDAGAIRLSVQLGFRPQKIQLGDLRLVNYGQSKRLEDLEVSPVAYKGMKPDAPWRREARERIEKHRKSDIVVVVTDGDGKSVEGATVSLRQTGHAFGFGGPYSTRGHVERESSDDLKTMQKHFKTFFNKAVLPNALKWKQYKWRGLTAAPKAYDWLTQNGIPVRGHCVIWPGWNYMPKEVREFENDPKTLRRLTMERIDTLMKDWSGKLVEWDVVNELYMQDDLVQLCGREIVVDWFKRMRELDPRAKLYYNDANTLANNQPGHADHYYETIQWLLEQGAPVDGMGFQSHIHSFAPPEVVYQRIERVAQLGPEIQVTEFDVRHSDAAAEILANYMRDYMTVVFSHPKTVGIVTWLAGNPLREAGTAKGMDQAAFFDPDWNLRPPGRVWLDLTTKEWVTNVEGETDDNGEFETRGFKGLYEVSIRKGERTATLNQNVTEDTSVPIVLN